MRFQPFGARNAPYPLRQDSHHATTHKGSYTQVQRAQSEAVNEHLPSENLRKKIEADVLKSIDTVVTNMIVDLFNRQIELARKSFALEEKALEVQRQTELNRQKEIYLAEGQKILQVNFPTTHEAVRSIELQQIRKEIEIEVRSQYRQSDTKLAGKFQELRARETHLELLQKNWKSQAQEALKSELRQAIEDEIAGEIVDREYGRVFREGKEAGHAESVVAAEKEGFLRGYQTARETQDRMWAMKKGTLPHDSPDLDFLFDFSHPDNPFNRGMQIGSRANVQEPPKAPPSTPRRTLYQELHGAGAQYNGHTVLANGNVARPVDGPIQLAEGVAPNGVGRTAEVEVTQNLMDM